MNITLSPQPLQKRINNDTITTWLKLKPLSKIRGRSEAVAAMF
jgi:hypothetical protein